METREHKAEADIRTLIERWASAVQRQDIATIVADHTAGFLMFDVPPPNELKGIDAYRESWAPFFEHFKQGGTFAIERLDVTAGADVAFATALLRCGHQSGAGTRSGRPAPPHRWATEAGGPLDDRSRASFISVRVSARRATAFAARDNVIGFGFKLPCS
jgi:ketosteroid isomerase-like protein